MLERLEDRTVPSSISGLSPASGSNAGGGALVVTGSGFSNASALTFGGVNASYYFVMSDTTIMATTPAHATGVVDVTVTAPSGTSQVTAADQYTYLPPATTTFLFSSADPSTMGQAVTLTATVSNGGHGTPTGTVTFEDGATVIGTGTVSTGGQASLTTASLALGNHWITAVYSGDANDSGSTSFALGQMVNSPSPSSIWTVVNNGDLGHGDWMARTGDLRFCLTNAPAGATIDFAIGAPGSQQTITINPSMGALPTVSQSVTINGFSQGSGPQGLPLIALNGGNMASVGLGVSAGGVTIEGLAIYGFTMYGVSLGNSSGQPGDVVEGCLIGTDANGDTEIGNEQIGNGTGVLVAGPNDTIGDPAGMLTTVVSGNNQDGIDVSGVNAVGDLINDVWVGVGLTGLTPLGNWMNGIAITNAIGAVVAGNVISGQRNGDAVQLSGTSNSLVKDNYIGVGKDGFTPVGNAGSGVRVIGSGSNNTIGGTTPAAQNIIAGNGGSGVVLSANGTNTTVTGNVVSGNYIGLDKNGNDQGNRQDGVNINGGASSNTIGGTAAGAGNVISGNISDGVSISGTGTSNNVVAGNNIGTNVGGTAGTDSTGLSTSNLDNGISIMGGASYNMVGGTVAGSLNVISGNTIFGVLIADPGTSYNRVAGNYIGTDWFGGTAIANGAMGVRIENGASYNTVGGLAANYRNVISGNGRSGVTITDEGTSKNVVAGNYIGTDKSGLIGLANGTNGVTIQDGATSNTVGDTIGGGLNVIAGNGGSGVCITDPGTSKNIVAGNYIGTDKSGGTALANGADGVTIQLSATNNTVGGTAAGSLNVISGDTGSGVNITDAGTNNNVVAGNYIGTDKNGTVKIPNHVNGVMIQQGASSNTVGGTVAGSLNVISGNAFDGVEIKDVGTSQNLIAGDYIGTDFLGGTAIANRFDGVYIYNASGNTVGAPAPANGLDTTLTVISGNGGAGVHIYYQASNNRVINSYIGTDKTGAAKIPNHVGVAIDGLSSSNTIGGLQGTGSLNLISGNGGGLAGNGAGAGVAVLSGSTNNVVEGDYIGTDISGKKALGNASDGVFVSAVAGNGNTIGGTAATAGNVISANSGYGVDLDSAAFVDWNDIGTDPAGNENPLLHNQGGWTNGTPPVGHNKIQNAS